MADWSPAGMYKQFGEALFKGITPEGTPIATSQEALMPQSMTPAPQPAARAALRSYVPPTQQGSGVSPQAGLDAAWAQYQKLANPVTPSVVEPQFRPKTMGEMVVSDIRSPFAKLAGGARTLFGGSTAKGYAQPQDITRI